MTKDRDVAEAVVAYIRGKGPDASTKHSKLIRHLASTLTNSHPSAAAIYGSIITRTRSLWQAAGVSREGDGKSRPYVYTWTAPSKTTKTTSSAPPSKTPSKCGVKRKAPEPESETETETDVESEDSDAEDSSEDFSDSDSVSSDNDNNDNNTADEPAAEPAAKRLRIKSQTEDKITLVTVRSDVSADESEAGSESESESSDESMSSDTKAVNAACDSDSDSEPAAKRARVESLESDVHYASSDIVYKTSSSNATLGIVRRAVSESLGEWYDLECDIDKRAVKVWDSCSVAWLYVQPEARKRLLSCIDDVTDALREKFLKDDDVEYTLSYREILLTITRTLGDSALEAAENAVEVYGADYGGNKDVRDGLVEYEKAGSLTYDSDGYVRIKVPASDRKAGKFEAADWRTEFVNTGIVGRMRDVFDSKPRDKVRALVIDAEDAGTARCLVKWGGLDPRNIEIVNATVADSILDGVEEDFVVFPGTMAESLMSMAGPVANTTEKWDAVIMDYYSTWRGNTWSKPSADMRLLFGRRALSSVSVVKLVVSPYACKREQRIDGVIEFVKECADRNDYFVYEYKAVLSPSNSGRGKMLHFLFHVRDVHAERENTRKEAERRAADAVIANAARANAEARSRRADMAEAYVGQPIYAKLRGYTFHGVVSSVTLRRHRTPKVNVEDKNGRVSSMNAMVTGWIEEARKKDNVEFEPPRRSAWRTIVVKPPGESGFKPLYRTPLYDLRQ